MEWAYRNNRRIYQSAAALGVLLVVADLISSPLSFLGRLMLVAGTCIVVPFCFYSMRAVLGLQLRLHGFSPFVSTACRAMFVFFGAWAVFALLVPLFSRTQIPARATGFLMFASFALGALEVYARGRRLSEASRLAI